MQWCILSWLLEAKCRRYRLYAFTRQELRESCLSHGEQRRLEASAGGRFQKIGYTSTQAGVFRSRQQHASTTLRSAHATMPWTGKFEEAQNPKRTMARLLDFLREGCQGPHPWWHLGIRRPPGIEPGWTYFQPSLAHHLRHKILAAVNETKSLGSDRNCLLDLPADFEFPVEHIELPCRNVYSAPKPAARAAAKWNRSYDRFTPWTLAPVTLPCRQYEHRIRDLPADEPTFLSYQLPWEATDGCRF